MNNCLRRLVEISGYIINPMILKFWNENDYLLSFFFHGLYKTNQEKGLNHIDPQQNMTVQQFTDFIDYFLENGYKFIGPDDLHKGLPEHQRYIMLTFDDGYFNNTLAVEILNKYKFPAIFFVTVRNVIENKSFWWDVVYRNRAKEGVTREKIRKELNYLKEFDYKYIDNYILQTFGTDAFKPWSDIDRPFTEKEIIHLAGNPLVYFGNHTFNHSILINCDKEEISSEFIESGRCLSEMTGSAPLLVAFPNGDFDKLTLEVAEDVGFRYAFTAKPRKNRLPLENKKLISIDRFMSNNNGIKYYGSFYRIGYSPGAVYSGLVRLLKPASGDNDY